MAGGRVNPGLINRRAMEMEMFRSGGEVSLRAGIRSLMLPKSGGAQPAPTVNLTMNAPVTVKGAGGSPEATGRQVGQAIQRSTRLGYT
jgi:hypothetical protein